MPCDSGFWTMTIGDLATWVGGLASAAAAFAAWWAARVAVKIAKLPIDEARRDRQETARIFSRAIGNEMKEIASAAREFIAVAPVRYGTDWQDGHDYLRTVRLNPMLATSRSIPFINCFGSVDAALVMDVISAKGKFDDRIALLGGLDARHWNVGDECRLAMHDAGGRALELAEAADAAQAAMSRYTHD